MSIPAKRRPLKLMPSLRLLGRKEGTTAAGYINLLVSDVTSGSMAASDKRSIVAFSELFEIDPDDLAFVLAQFRANGLRKKATIRLALAQAVLNCLAADPRCNLPLKWMSENIAEAEGLGPVPQQDDIGS